MTFLYIYILGVNLIAFSIMGLDKKKAVSGRRRTPEKTLFLLAIVGGSIGIYGAMRLFRHKTKHTSFRLGIPMLIILQIIIVVSIFVNNH